MCFVITYELIPYVGLVLSVNMIPIFQIVIPV